MKRIGRIRGLDGESCSVVATPDVEKMEEEDRQASEQSQQHTHLPSIMVMTSLT